MPVIKLHEVNVHYSDTGAGEPVAAVIGKHIEMCP